MHNAQQPASHGSFLLAAPSESRTPLPVEVLLALPVCASVNFQKGLQRTALALLLGFHLLLRPGEIGSAKRGHLTLPSDTSGASDSGRHAGLQIRGRWASQKSMFRYTQLSLAAVSVHNVLVMQREKIFALAPMASTLLDPL
eukprot:4688987-Amphidinium_carterae.1